MRRRLIATSAVLGALTAAGTAGAADTQIAQLPRDTPIDALAGHVVWSAPVDGGRAWRLVVHHDGRQRQLPVRPARRPFDVDLGMRGGRLLAVYSRCEPGCDVYRYDFASRTERRLGAVSRRRSDEREPSIWGSGVAFVRGRAAYLRRGGTTRRLRLAARVTAPSDLDLRGRVAIQSGREYGGQISTATPRRGTLALQLFGSGAATTDYWTAHPTYGDRDTVYWGVGAVGDAGDWGEIWRLDQRTGRVERSTTRVEPFTRFAQDGAVSYYAVPTTEDDPRGPLALHRLDDRLSFVPAPRRIGGD